MLLTGSQEMPLPAIDCLTKTSVEAITANKSPPETLSLPGGVLNSYLVQAFSSSRLGVVKLRPWLKG